MDLYQYVKGLFADDPRDELTNHFQHQDREQTRGRMRTEAQTSTAATPTNHTEQRRYFTGTVTSLNEDGGMIDNHVYFDLDCVIGGREPYVGGAAHVTATRPHVHAGWRAIRVDLLMEWRPDEGSEIELVVGVVSGWSHTKCVVESGSGEVTFAPNECRPASGYRPHIGDCIEVGLYTFVHLKIPYVSSLHYIIIWGHADVHMEAISIYGINLVSQLHYAYFRWNCFIKMGLQLSMV